jgi:hypothetical protein
MTVDRKRHPEKQHWPKMWRDDGRQIDESEEQPKNAESATDEMREPDSNVTLKRDLERTKQCTSRVSTEAGMQIQRRISGWMEKGKRGLKTTCWT